MTLFFARRGAFFRRALALCCAGLLSFGCQTVPEKGLSEAQIQTLREIGFHREESGWGFDLDGLLLFDSNESVLSHENKQTIARVVKVVREIGIEHLRVEGYADSSGRKRFNDKLSLLRARAVAREIERNGVPYANISIRGFGVANPVGDNATREGRAQNRRVVIIVPTE